MPAVQKSRIVFTLVRLAKRTKQKRNKNIKVDIEGIIQLHIEVRICILSYRLPPPLSLFLSIM